MEILRQTYDVFEANMLDPDFKSIYENTWSPTYTWNDLYLAALNAANCAGRILPAERVRPLQEKALDMILYRFAQDRYKMLFEAVPKSGESDLSDPVGRFINPGHAMESCWMCLEALNEREDARRKARVLEIVDWTYATGYDGEYGGMFAYLDARGEKPTPLDWHKEANVYGTIKFSGSTRSPFGGSRPRISNPAISNISGFLKACTGSASGTFMTGYTGSGMSACAGMVR